MERGLNNLRDALRNDWLVADSKVKAALLVKLNQIADGNGVVFGGSKAAPFKGSIPAGQILIPTGGTTGQPRYAIHTWQTLKNAAENLAARIAGPINSCCILPMHHVSGFMQVVRALVTGGRVHVTDARALDVEPEGLCLSIVPTQLNRFMEQPELLKKLKRFRIIFLGGAAVSKKLLHQAREQQLPLAPCYGMTETAAMVTLLKPSDFLAGIYSSGIALPNTKVTIQDQRIHIQTNSLYRGYWGDEQGEIESIGTQDHGMIDKDYHLHVHGRLDRMIISGGEKIDPAEVEATLLMYEDIKEALVLGVEDKEWGQRVIAFVVGHTGVNLPNSLRKILPSHKVPKEFHHVNHLPLNRSGKVDWEQVKNVVG